VRGAERPGAAAAPPWEGPWEPAWGGCPAAAGHLSRLGYGHLVALVATGCLSLWLFWVFGRESIFKFSHTKLRKKFQNLDLEPDSTRKPLQPARWVCEGGREAGQGGSSSGAPTVCGPSGGLLGGSPSRAPLCAGSLGICLGGMSGCGWAPLQAWEQAFGCPRGIGAAALPACWP